MSENIVANVRPVSRADLVPKIIFITLLHLIKLSVNICDIDIDIDHTQYEKITKIS